MQALSILNEEFVKGCLERARGSLETHGSFQPALFVQFPDGATEGYRLAFPESAKQRAEYLTNLGAALRQAGKHIHRALVCIDVWMVVNEDGNTDLSVSPSQHPTRQEAIVILGRDATREQTVILIYAYERGADNKLVSGHIQPTAGCDLGFADYLFEDTPMAG